MLSVGVQQYESAPVHELLTIRKCTGEYEKNEEAGFLSSSGEVR